MIKKRFEGITSGEALKNIDKRDWEFLYIDIDAETIFMICDEKLEELESKVSLLMSKL